MKRVKLFACFFIFLIVTTFVNSKALPPDEPEPENYEEPGFWKRQFIRAGSLASRVGNSFGSTATKLTQIVEKICAFFKKIIPIVGAICTVGQFKFCAMDGVPQVDPSQLAGSDYYSGRTLRSMNEEWKIKEMEKELEKMTTGYQPIDLNAPD